MSKDNGLMPEKRVAPLVSLPLGIYKFRDVGTDKKPNYILDKMKIMKFPEYRLYGEDKENIDHYWKGYQLSDKNMAVKLTGTSGSGKTTQAEVLCNKALAVGMSVIKVSEIIGTMELYVLIEQMSNVVVMLDEYEKTFDFKLQNRMLGMFSSYDTPKKLFLITSNESINQYMDNRLGRVLYGQDFTRMNKSSYNEFIKVNCPKGNKEFLKELDKKYKSAKMFTIDNLKFILEEHKKFPELKFDRILSILNLPMMSGGGNLKLIKVYDRECKQELTFTPASFKREWFIVEEWSERIYVNKYVEPVKEEKKEVKEGATSALPSPFTSQPPSNGRIVLNLRYGDDLYEINDELHVLLVKDRFEVTFEES